MPLPPESLTLDEQELRAYMAGDPYVMGLIHALQDARAEIERLKLALEAEEARVQELVDAWRFATGIDDPGGV